MMKFGQWGDSPAKEDGSFSFGPVNVVNSTAHTAPSTLIKERETQLPVVEWLRFGGMEGMVALGRGWVQGRMEKRWQG